MNILNFYEVYEENKKLDKIFLEHYGKSEDIILKNKLELLVELGELCNESKCFKYWSKKDSNKDLVLEEYADVLLMIFYFFRELDISLDEKYLKENNLDLVNEFIYLFNMISRLKDEYNKEIIKDIFINTLRLGKLLNFTEQEIINSCFSKINITKERMNSNY